MIKNLMKRVRSVKRLGRKSQFCNPTPSQPIKQKIRARLDIFGDVSCGHFWSPFVHLLQAEEARKNITWRDGIFFKDRGLDF
jgi:hypothetical protein